jgi:hypothetical protein
MNDDELMTLVAAQRDTVPMTTRIEEIIRRGRAARLRRLVAGAAGILAAAAGAAFAVSTLAPGSHQDTARLTSWVVTEQPDGTISVTINELDNLTGLQGKLRADGVPASVSVMGRPNPACLPYPGGSPRSGGDPATPLLRQVFPRPYRMLPKVVAIPPSPHSVVVVIDPSALPAGAGVQLNASQFRSSQVQILHPTAFLTATVVHASAQCTGS